MPPPPQGQTYFGTSTIFSRLMKINYFKRTTCFNVAHFKKKIASNAPATTPPPHYSAYEKQIADSLGNLLTEIENQEQDINNWLVTLPKIKERTQSYLDQASVQQSLLSRQYPLSYLEKLTSSELVAHRTQLEEINEIINERRLVLNVLETFSDLVDEISEEIDSNLMGY